MRRGKWIDEAGVLAALVLVSVLFGILIGPGFFRGANLELIARQAAIVCVSAFGMTMVIVTHELKFARDIGDFNVYMEDGEIVETGSRDIYDHPRDPRTQRFLKAVL